MDNVAEGVAVELDDSEAEELPVSLLLVLGEPVALGMMRDARRHGSEMPLSAKATGTCVCPLLLQQVNPPAADSAHVSDGPATTATRLNVATDAGTAVRSTPQPQPQQISEPAAESVHVCAYPTATPT